MTAKTKRAETAVDRWNRVVREAYTETPGASDAPEVPYDEIKRQLAAAGVDLEAEHREADATYDAMMTKLKADERRREAADEADAHASTVAWVAPTERRPAARPPRSGALWVAYAIAAAAAVGSVAYAVGHRDRVPEPPPRDPPVVKPVETAPAPTAPPSPAPTESPAQPDKGDKRAPR